VLAAQVRDAPPAFELADVGEREPCHFVAAQAQPIMTASMARSRLPFRVSGSGRLMSASAWRLVSQFPVRVPSILAPRTSRMPCAATGPAIRCRWLPGPVIFRSWNQPVYRVPWQGTNSSGNVSQRLRWTSSIRVPRAGGPTPTDPDSGISSPGWRSQCC
jgi:hypothetical protein